MNFFYHACHILWFKNNDNCLKILRTFKRNKSRERKRDKRTTVLSLTVMHIQQQQQLVTCTQQIISTKSVQSPPSALNMTLPTFAAERRCACSKAPIEARNYRLVSPVVVCSAANPTVDVADVDQWDGRKDARPLYRPCIRVATHPGFVPGTPDVPYFKACSLLSTSSGNTAVQSWGHCNWYIGAIFYCKVTNLPCPAAYI